MLETIREHAAALLDASGSGAGADARHASYYAQLIEATPMHGPGTAQALKLVDADLDNLRAAIDRLNSGPATTTPHCGSRPPSTATST